jgi:Zinc carboxypeptidase
MPPAPPDRPDATAFHFHSYTYPEDETRGAFRLSDGLATTSNTQVYSLTEDLQGLVAWGNAKNVPNLRLTRMSAVVGGAQTLGHRDTLMLSLGGPTPGQGLPDVPAVVFTGGIHAREWIAVEIVYLLAEYLIKHYQANPQGNYQPTIKDLVDHRRIYLIPMVNPDGHYQTVFTDRKWRKNLRVLPTTPAEWVKLLTDDGALGKDPPPFRDVGVPAEPPDALATYDVPIYEVGNGVGLDASGAFTAMLGNGKTGVDLNRNFLTLAWGYDGLDYPAGKDPQLGGSFDPSGDTYFGPKAASEPETANVQVALATAAAAPGIAVSIDYHSRAMLILYPTEAYDYGRVSPAYKKLGETLHQLVRTNADPPDYQLGIPRALLSGDATGTLMDRAAQQHQSQAFTIELDPSLAVKDGWLLSEDQICGVFEKNIRGALAALSAPRNPASLDDAQQLYAQVVQKFLTWHVSGSGNLLPAEAGAQ